MKAKVPAVVAYAWNDARSLRRDIKAIETAFVPYYSRWLSVGDMWDGKPVEEEQLSSSVTKSTPEIDRAVHALLELLRERATQLECKPCKKPA